MADKMTRNVFGVVMASLWHVVMTLVMFPTLLIQWMTGTPTIKHLPRRKMSENGQSRNGVTNDPITEKELKMIKDSWEVLSKDKKANGVALFMKLFTMVPESQTLFKHFKNVPLKDLDFDRETRTAKSKKMLAHALAVMYDLESYIDSLDDMECLEELVKKVALSHKPRNIGADKFQLLTPVIQAVIEDLMKDNESIDLKAAKSGWGKLMKKVCEIVEETQKED